MKNNTTPSWVPQRYNDKTRSAEVAMIKTLASDLGTATKGNFGATLEAIVMRASSLLSDEAVRTGRGLKPVIR